MAIAAASGAVGLLQLLLVVRSGAVAFFTLAERAALPRIVALDRSASWREGESVASTPIRIRAAELLE